MAPRILFVRSSYEDYLADSLLHGLRLELGANVVDFPKAEFLYDTYPESLKKTLYGRGFTLYGSLPDLPVDRTRIEERLHRGEFDVLVFADLLRTSAELLHWVALAPQATKVLVDGGDSSELYPPPSLLRAEPLKVLSALRVAASRGRWLYFKREWDRSRSESILERTLAWLHPPSSATRGIAFSIPESKVRENPVPKTKRFPKHIVDAEVAAFVGAQTKYAFENEQAYYDDLASSRFGITTKRAGWDCMRHYEIAANGTVPCFRDLNLKAPECAPQGLNDTNAIQYRDVSDLMAKTDQLTDDAYEALRSGALAWARQNTTRVRARAFLETLGLGA